MLTLAGLVDDWTYCLISCLNLYGLYSEVDWPSSKRFSSLIFIVLIFFIGFSKASELSRFSRAGLLNGVGIETLFNCFYVGSEFICFAFICIYSFIIFGWLADN